MPGTLNLEKLPMDGEAIDPREEPTMANFLTSIILTVF